MTTEIPASSDTVSTRDTAPPDAPKPPDSSFRTRVKSALILAPIVLILLGFGGGAFALLIAVTAGIGAYEWTRMVTAGGGYPRMIAEMAGFVTGFGTISAAMVGNPVIALFLLIALSFMVFAYNYSSSGGAVRRVILGIVYIGFSCCIMIWLRNWSVTNMQGLFNLLTLLFIVWGSDSFAYFTGRTLGGPKLAPAISPKKTWSGFIGGSLGAGLIAAGLATPVVTGLLDVTPLGGTGPVFYLILGFVLSMVGQAGDLLISLIKRHYNFKDTGTVIPGHGGILDRIDALLLVALVFGSVAKLMGA